jgi:hypothetical protein
MNFRNEIQRRAEGTRPRLGQCFPDFSAARNAHYCFAAGCHDNAPGLLDV